jgi:drug/metabolite transporter (DMT)-like permease
MENTPKSKQYYSNFLQLHLIVLLWGFTAVIGAIITLKAYDLVWLRMGITTLFVGAYALLSKQSLAISKIGLRKTMLTGILIAMHWICFYQAIKTSNVSVTLAVFSTASFFMSIMEPLYYKRKVIVYEIVLGLIIIAVLLFLFRIEERYMEGILYSLGASFLSVMFTLSNGRLAQLYTPIVISFYEMLAGVVFLLLFLFVTQYPFVALATISQADWYWMLFFCGVCTAFPFIRVTGLMQTISPYTVVLSVNLEPVYGIIFAYYFLDEGKAMTTQFYFGAAIIFLTVLANGVLKSKFPVNEIKAN